MLTCYREKVYHVNKVDVVSRVHMLIASDTLSCMPRKTLPQAAKKVGIAARIDPDLLKRLQDVADADDRTLSYMVEKAIRLLLDGIHAKASKKPK